MTRRTTEAYVSALKYVHTYLIPLFGKGFIIDFEKAMRSALRRVVPNVKVIGCWFHFCQAVRRKAASMKNLFELIRTDSEVNLFFRRFQCLALLPGEHIEETFMKLSRDALKISEHFGNFIDYFHEEWIVRVTPRHFSVFDEVTRTTCAAESNNCNSNRIFKTHGNFYSFCEILQKEELSIIQEIETDFDGRALRRREKKFYKERSRLIVDYSEQLKKNEIGPYTFLKIMANIKNNVLYSDSSISVEDVEVELSSNIELESPPVDTVLKIPHETTEIEKNDDIPLLVYLGDSEDSFVLDTETDEGDI